MPVWHDGGTANDFTEIAVASAVFGERSYEAVMVVVLGILPLKTQRGTRSRKPSKSRLQPSTSRKYTSGKSAPKVFLHGTIRESHNRYSSMIRTRYQDAERIKN